MLKDMLKTVFQDTCTSELETIQMASVGRWLNKLGTCLPWNTTQEQKGTNYYLHNNLDWFQENYTEGKQANLKRLSILESM